MYTYFLDTETCGYHGPVVLIQYLKLPADHQGTLSKADIESQIVLYEVWEEPIEATLLLIEDICANGIVGFNLAFDWFHLCQLYTTLFLADDKSAKPNILEYALNEPKARDLDICLKPTHCLDLMLHARKGPYQSTMDRKDIKIKRVPTVLARPLAEELTERLPLKDIYFARKADKTKRWSVQDITDDDGEIIPDLKNLVLKFAPSSALKALAVDALDLKDPVHIFSDVEVPSKMQPVEFGYAPYALAVGTPNYWKQAWPEVMAYHIDHWGTHPIARQYARDDVRYTYLLYRRFMTDGSAPIMDDVDSILACMVGAVRWRGYTVDIKMLTELRNQSVERVKKCKFNFNSHRVCVTYLTQVMSPTEQVAIHKDGKITTSSVVLEEVAKWREDTVCACNGLQDDCPSCKGTGLMASDKWHPAALRAQEILEARRAQKEVEMFDKILKANRFHASFKIIGTLSTRMSGADGLNPQGIKRTTDVRRCFTLKHEGEILVGGDFKAFEVVIADAVYQDPVLHAELLEGKKIHGLFGVALFPGTTYEDILATDGLPGDLDLYSRAKRGVFGMLYGGNDSTLANRIGVTIEAASDAYQRWIGKYEVWGQRRKGYFEMFCSMRQVGGLGTRIEWRDPAGYVESLLGFRRFFTLENQICKILFDLAENPPKEWKGYDGKITRRDDRGVQTEAGAMRSAIFAAAFAIQAANMRAAANHVIQSTGAGLTKLLQADIWALQPAGVESWRVQPMNIHDEIIASVKKDVVEDVENVVKRFVARERSIVPLLDISWKSDIESWASKK